MSAVAAPASSAAPVDVKLVAGATTDLDGMPLDLAMQLTQATGGSDAKAASLQQDDGKGAAASGAAQAQAGGADGKAKFTVKDLQANLSTILEAQGYDKVSDGTVKEVNTMFVKGEFVPMFAKKYLLTQMRKFMSCRVGLYKEVFSSLAKIQTKAKSFCVLGGGSGNEQIGITLAIPDAKTVAIDDSKDYTQFQIALHGLLRVPFPSATHSFLCADLSKEMTHELAAKIAGADVVTMCYVAIEIYQKNKPERLIGVLKQIVEVMRPNSTLLILDSLGKFNGVRGVAVREFILKAFPKGAVQPDVTAKFESLDEDLKSESAWAMAQTGAWRFAFTKV